MSAFMPATDCSAAGCSRHLLRRPWWDVRAQSPGTHAPRVAAAHRSTHGPSRREASAAPWPCVAAGARRTKCSATPESHGGTKPTNGPGIIPDDLPIAAVLPEVLEVLEEGLHVVLQAPPGAGKTTCLPLALLLARPQWLKPGHRILVLEPRRLAARAAARRMAGLLGEGVGHRVGLTIRLDSQVSKETVVEVVTEGVLLRRLRRDPALRGVGAVLFDEFHERSLEADAGLALCVAAAASARPDLRLVVMSATLDSTAPRVMELLGAPGQQSGPAGPGEGAPPRARHVRSEGRSYPVAVKYLGLPGQGRNELEKAVAKAVIQALTSDKARLNPRAMHAATILRDKLIIKCGHGDVLAFLPGAGEIRRVGALLGDSKALPRAVRVLPLYGDLPADQQDAAVRPGPPGERRVVLSTPIAESSLTIEGVRIVVDSGLARAPRFSPAAAMDRLQLVRVSRSSADQRAGRAGRTAPGVCYRLWTEKGHAALADAVVPEIQSVDLAPLALQLALWRAQWAADGGADGAGLAGGEAPAHPEERLQWVDPPDAEGMRVAREVLRRLGALDTDGHVTPRGRLLAELGTHPRLAHMICYAHALECTEAGILLAALLQERDVLQGRGRGSDVRARLDALQRLGELERQQGRGGTAPSGGGGGGGAGVEVDFAAARRVIAAAQLLFRQLEGALAPRERDQSGPVTKERDRHSSAAARFAGGGPPGAAAAPAAGPAAGGGRSGGAGERGRDGGAGADAPALEDEEAMVGVLVAVAYPDRVAQRRDRANRHRDGFLLASGQSARLPDKNDPLGDADWLAVAALGGDTSGGRNENIFLAAPLSRAAVAAHLAPQLEERRAVFWSDSAKAVVALRQQTLGELVLHEEDAGDSAFVGGEAGPASSGDQGAVLQALLQGVRAAGLRALTARSPATDALRRRAAWLRKHGAQAGGADLPDLSDGALLVSLNQWFPPLLASAGAPAGGVRTLADLQALDWDGAIRGMLTDGQLALLDEMAPETLPLAAPGGGGNIAVSYAQHPPTARVAIRDALQLRQHPAILGGKMRVRLELTDSAGKKLAAADDIAQFWKGPAYKKLRPALLKKHSSVPWP